MNSEERAEMCIRDRVKCSESNRIETSVLPAGHHYIPVELDEVVFFMRKGHLLPLAKDGSTLVSMRLLSLHFTRTCSISSGR